MGNQSNFQALINFYRLYKGKGDIKFDQNFLSANNLEVASDDWDEIKNNNFSKLVVNGSNYSNQTSVINIKDDDKVTFKLLLDANPKKYFDNINHLVANFTPLQKGNLPSHFYLIDEDYYYPDDAERREVKNLKQVCDFINFLEKVLPHTEGRMDDHPSLKFVVFSKDLYNTKKSNKITFSSKFDYDLLPEEIENLSFLEELGAENDLHTYERITIFQNSLVELLTLAPQNQEFNYVLENLDKLESIYKNNYAIYINDFHLEEFKKDVISSYTAFSTEIDNKISDLVSKMFAVPAVSTAMLFLRTTQANNASSNNADYSFLIYATIIVTLVLSGLHLKWVLNSLCMIENNIKEVLGRFEAEQYDSTSFVSERKGELLKRISDAAFNGYIFASLVSVLAVIVVFYI